MSQPNWPDCIDDGYFVNGCLHPGYVVRARMMEYAKQMANGGLTTHQIRRFFQHCRAIEARLREQPFQNWRAMESSIRKKPRFC